MYASETGSFAVKSMSFFLVCTCITHKCIIYDCLKEPTIVIVFIVG